MKKFVDVYSTRDEARSAKAKFCREELARTRKDGYHQAFWLTLEFALVVDLGVHLTHATYLFEEDGMLVSYCVYSFHRPVPSFVFVFVTTGYAFIYFYDSYRAYFPGFPLHIFASSCASATLGVRGNPQVRMGLALTREADGTFGRPHLPNVDTIIYSASTAKVT